MDAIRAQLDKLMGVNRNGLKNIVTYTFSSPEICRNHICGLCVHDLFNNTKRDAGPCAKVHSEKLKSEYAEKRLMDPSKVFDFEIEFASYISKLMADIDLEVARAELKIKSELGGDGVLTHNFARNNKQLTELNELIDTKIIDADKLGAKGMIDESLAILEEVDLLKKEKNVLEATIRAQKTEIKPQEATSRESSTLAQKLIACKICAALLSMHDSEKRLADHYMGKLHMGCLAIREMNKRLRERNIASYSLYDRDVIITSNGRLSSSESDSYMNNSSNGGGGGRYGSTAYHSHRHDGHADGYGSYDHPSYRSASHGGSGGPRGHHFGRSHGGSGGSRDYSSRREPRDRGRSRSPPGHRYR